MKPVAIKLRQLVFPTQLPFDKHMFFQSMMSFDDQNRGCSFKSNTSFDANDRVTYMNIATDTKWPCDFLKHLNCFYSMRIFFTIYFDQFTFLKSKCYIFFFFFCHLI